MSNTGYKYISKSKDLYYVQKTIKGKCIHFRVTTDLDVALEHREYCINNNWDIEKCKVTQKRDPKMKYIHKLRNGHYQVSKNLNGKRVHFGNFKKLDDAQEHRDYCVENNWNFKCKHLSGRNKYDLPKYITWNKQRGTYTVAKNIGGKVFAVTGFKDLEAAIIERDLLIKCDWDYEKVVEYDEMMGTL